MSQSPIDAAENLFLQSIKSRHTKKMYCFALERYATFCKAEEYSDLLRGEDREIEDRLQRYVMHLNSDSYSNSWRNIAFSAIRKFYIVNRRNINWPWLASFKQRRDEAYNEDQPYTREQIEKMLELAEDDRTRAILLIYATSGIRLGALTTLKIGHVKYIETDKLLALIVYAGSKDRYVTFITPQATKYLNRYMKQRFRKLENLPQDEPLISNRNYPQLPTSEDSLASLIRDLAIKAGIRSEHGDATERKPIMRVHGLRKFFGTTLAGIEGIKKEHRERFLGHVTNLDKSYIKLDVPELLPLYRQAIKALTFNFGNPMTEGSAVSRP